MKQSLDLMKKPVILNPSKAMVLFKAVQSTTVTNKLALVRKITVDPKIQLLVGAVIFLLSTAIMVITGIFSEVQLRRAKKEERRKI